MLELGPSSDIFELVKDNEAHLDLVLRMSEEAREAMKKMPVGAFKMFVCGLVNAKKDRHFFLEASPDIQVDGIHYYMQRVRNSFVETCGKGDLEKVNNAIATLIVVEVPQAALYLAAQNGHLALVRRLLKVDNVREKAIDGFNLNIGVDETVSEKNNILIKFLADNNPKLKEKMDRYNEARALCFSYRSLKMKHVQGENVRSHLLGMPKELVNIVANMIRTSSPPAA